jgi:putative protease
MQNKPEILAPAGDKNAFLAAIAAGADAVYLGLKHFSARMAADNFSSTELSKMVELAHKEDRKVYVAMNTLVKPGDPDSAARLIGRLQRDVGPDALIMQDLGMVEVAKQVGFKGELHLSTLANVTHPAAFKVAQEMGVDRIILPRELDIDEVRQCSDACPEDMSLEMFVHGALCYCVSGRCYWSSYMGGKSGLRGRCVQPCRRVYQQKARKGRFFSCQDLSLDVLAKTLLPIENLKSWKIEGRKKGPHYVYYVTTAYKLLRDNPDDPQARKQAEQILEQALGRPSTHSTFLPQKRRSPVEPGEQTSSGRLVGKITVEPPAKAKKGERTYPKYFFKPRFELLKADYLRIGYEDEQWHFTDRVPHPVPKNGTFVLRAPAGKRPKSGTPVFLIDRREQEMINLLKEWDGKLSRCKGTKSEAIEAPLTYPAAGKRPRAVTILMRDHLPHGKEGKAGKFTDTANGIWLGERALKTVGRTLFGRMSWWLPPVIWPNEENKWRSMIKMALRQGARHFVLGSPWQAAFFEGARNIDLIAGPFCNPSNPAAIAALKKMGFKGAIISPELSQEDIMELPKQSCLPLGVVLYGYWPMGISRFPLEGVKPNEPFYSPKGECFWLRRYGQNSWIYPGWPMDIEKNKQQLLQAGYTMFVKLMEKPPSVVPEAKRTSPFNWDLNLL